MVGKLGHLWILIGFIGAVYGYRRFQREIPNGDRVPHPCGTGIWAAVGHKQPYHVMGKNKFGELMQRDFVRGGKTWKEICPLDADGDGVSNGEELGDKACEWPNKSPRDPIGHPGYCEQRRGRCAFREASHPLCPHRLAGLGSGLPSSLPDIRTPPPHFGKHPQSLLTERLGGTSGFNPTLGGRRPSFDDFGLQTSFGDQPSMSQPTSRFGQTDTFGPSQTSQSFSSFGSDLSVPDPPMSGSFNLRRPSFNPDSFRTTGQSSSGGFDLASFNSQQGGIGGDLSMPFRGAERAGPGSSFWQPSQPAPSRNMEPRRDIFSRSLNQRAIQNGVSGFGGSFGGQRSIPSRQFGPERTMHERLVQRRIQRFRNSAFPGPPAAVGGGVDWRGISMGGVEAPYPFFRGASPIGPRRAGMFS